MQSRLLLRHCASSVQKPRQDTLVVHSRRRLRFRLLSTTSSYNNGDAAATSTGSNGASISSATRTDNYRRQGRQRRSNFQNLQSPSSSFQTQIQIIEHNNTYSCNHHRRRNVQTSSAPNSPAVPPMVKTASSEPPSLFEYDGNGSGNRPNQGDDEVLKFTNDSIQKLLQDELFAFETALQQNVSPFKDHDNHKSNDNVDMSLDVPINTTTPNTLDKLEDEMKFDIKETLKQQLRDIQQQQQQQQRRLEQPQQQSTTTTTTTTTPSINKKPTMAELLKSFNPHTPPAPGTSMEEVQEWLECAAQQESVEKYEAMIENAREREDYASMSLVQRHMLEWYNPLRTKILQEQEDYYSAEKKNTGANKYGPFLCTLQAEKLAIITAHEATMFALQKGGDGATLVTMVLQIANAVEAEVNVQRLLRQRMDDRALYKKEQKASAASTLESEPEHESERESEREHGLEGKAIDDDSLEINDESSNILIKTNTKNTNNKSWMYGPSHLQRFIDELNRSDLRRKGRVRIQRANQRAMKLLESAEPWSTPDKVALGVVLVQMLLESAKVDLRGKGRRFEYDEEGNSYGMPAFEYQKKWINEDKLVGFVTMSEDFYKMVVEDKFCSFDAMTTRHKPMVVPPLDWTSPTDGGYKVLRTEFMRARGCQLQVDALKEADLTTLMDGLNVLARVPWVINKNILSTAERCWDEGIALGDIPSRTDHDLPPEPTRPDDEYIDYKETQGEYQKYREALMKYRRIHQRNMDLRSLRCSALLKLNQADQFKEFEKIYFPYNVDFRGRAYPVPPHLSNIGSDLCRGMLTFSESKPLGPRGLYWLKVHLANLAGNDKISFDERAEFTEKNMENVRACVNDPFGENRWWMSLDDPFQGLATCYEIIAAIDSGSPETYESSLPVHMDGSCNGLQHYAALGRDKVGGTAVNLCPFDEPQDVYSGVMEEVIRRVAEEAEKFLDVDESDPDKLTKNERKALYDHRAAKLVNGLIDRGVVKRTVMTSVYGVTYIGAKKQIQEKIEEKLEDKGVDIDEMEDEIFAACGYLARVTMDVMGDLFQGARQTMNWLATCAKLISSQGQPVTWISPTGVPAVQPYRQKQPYTIVTLLQTVVLVNNNDNLPIHKNRQTSAFPPNYIHSLDSAHMLLTAIEMDKRGLTFSAVHDSFWTHAADIDEMNHVLRCCFVDLYNKPLLEELKQTWELQYPSLNFPDLPETGDLDLNDVKKAPYFFQ